MSSGSRTVAASVVLVTRSLIVRAIGLISTVVLARILGPDDFGLVALALLIIGFLDVFAQIGSEQYILRMDRVDDGALNRAWSLNVTLRAILALFLAVIGPALSAAYDQAALLPVLWVFAALMLVQPLENPGLWLLQREQKFSAIARLDIVAKIASTAVAVGTALAGGSYWALVAGRVTLSLLKVSGSYWLHAFRPRFTLSGVSRQVRFSIWLILQSLFGYSRANFDTFLVSSNFGRAELGSFHTMKYLAYIPSENVLTPAGTPLLRELSSVRDDGGEFRLLHNASFIAVAALALSMSLIMMSTSSQLVSVILGENWMQYAELFRWFAALIPAFFLFQHATRVCLVFGDSRATFLYELFAAAIVYLPFVYIGLRGLLAFTELRVELELLASSLFFVYTTVRFLSLTDLVRIVNGMLPILIACALATYGADAAVPETLGALVYLVSYAIIWSAAFASAIALSLLLVWRHQAEWSYLLARAAAFLRRKRAE